MSEKRPSVNVRHGIGWAGVLVLLGVFGIGPCNWCFSGDENLRELRHAVDVMVEARKALGGSE